MKSYFCTILLICLFWAVQTFCGKLVSAQEILWKEQVAWEGVPEYYQKWDYPDFNFPSELSVWKDERVKVSETLIGLLGDIPARPKQLNVQPYLKNK